MGTWGANTFDNDRACDWEEELEDVNDLSLVHNTLAQVIATGAEYLESGVACEGLAACEVIARLKGNWGIRDAYTEVIDNWVQRHPMEPPIELISQALAVIDRVLTIPSELMEAWAQVSENEQWREAVADLRSRVAK